MIALGIWVIALWLTAPLWGRVLLWAACALIEDMTGKLEADPRRTQTWAERRASLLMWVAAVVALALFFAVRS